MRVGLNAPVENYQLKTTSEYNDLNCWKKLLVIIGTIFFSIITLGIMGKQSYLWLKDRLQTKKIIVQTNNATTSAIPTPNATTPNILTPNTPVSPPSITPTVATPTIPTPHATTPNILTPNTVTPIIPTPITPAPPPTTPIVTISSISTSNTATSNAPVVEPPLIPVPISQSPIATRPTPSTSPIPLVPSAPPPPLVPSVPSVPLPSYPVLPKLTQLERAAGAGQGFPYYSQWFRDHSNAYHKEGDRWPEAQLQQFFEEGLLKYYVAQLSIDLLGFTPSQFEKELTTQERNMVYFHVNRLRRDPPQFKERIDTVIKPYIWTLTRLLNENTVPEVLPKKLLRLGVQYQRYKVVVEKISQSVTERGAAGMQTDLTGLLKVDRQTDEVQLVIYHWLKDCIRQLRAFSLDPSAGSFTYALPEFFSTNPAYQKLLDNC